jgi:hypothetical protein
MKRLYKFYRSFGRNGDLSGVFLATEEEVSSILGKKIYFGEVLGKHSDVSATMREEDFVLVLTSERFVEEWEEIGNLNNGINPFDYLDEERGIQFLDVEDSYEGDAYCSLTCAILGGKMTATEQEQNSKETK